MLAIMCMFSVATISRVPLPYQYSALSQFDQDPDEDLHDLEDNLHMLVEDSSSEDDAEDRKVCGERIKGGSNGIGKAGGVHSNLEKAEDRVEIDDEDGDDDVFPEEDCNAVSTTLLKSKWSLT